MGRLLGRLVSFDPGIEASQWLTDFLPMLTFVTEVGYEYRGTGTDFWPLLDARLHTELRIGGRSNVSRLFGIAHRDFGIAAPGNSAWERHFPHISWPIANAVVPRELHAPLSEALRQVVRAGIGPDDGGILLEATRRTAAGYGSRRLEVWLKRESVAVEVMRMLLSPGTAGWLAVPVIERINADLALDRRAAHALSDARAAVRPSSGRQARVDRARFRLSLDEGRIVAILLQGPILDAPDQTRLIADLRIRGNRIRVLPAAASMTLRDFLSGTCLDLGLSYPLPAAPLRRGDERIDPEAEPPKELARLQPEPATVFLQDPGGRSALALTKGDTVDADAILFLLHEADGLPRVRKLDLADRSDANLLHRSGISLIHREGSPRMFGLPVPGLHDTYAAGFPILAPRLCNGSFPALNGTISPQKSLVVGGVELAMWSPPPGTHSLGAAQSGPGVAMRFSVLDLPLSRRAKITVLPERPTLEDLLAESLEVRLEMPIPLDGCGLDLRLEFPDGQSVSAAGQVPHLPAVLAGRAPVLARLAEALREIDVDLAESARLTVHLSGFAATRVKLRPAPRLFRRDEGTGTWLRLRDGEEESPVGSLGATYEQPLLIQGLSAPAGPTSSLSLPDDFAVGALASGVVIRHRSRLSLGPLPRPATGPLLRQPADGDDGRGLLSVTRSWIGWRLAAAADPIADWTRRRAASALEAAVVGQLCGNTWQALEAEIDADLLSPAACLGRTAMRQLQASGTELPAITPGSDRRLLSQSLTSRFSEALEVIGSAPALLDDEVVESLDGALDQGWQDLRSAIIADGRVPFEELDLNLPPDSWKRALDEAEQLPVLPMFRPLILPAARWQMLADADYGGQSVSGIVDLLDACHVDAHRRSGARLMGRAELRALIELWLAPARLIEDDDWPVLLSRALSDAQTARATRYAALRSMIAKNDLPVEEAP